MHVMNTYAYKHPSQMTRKKADLGTAHFCTRIYHIFTFSDVLCQSVLPFFHFNSHEPGPCDLRIFINARVGFKTDKGAI